MDKPPPDELIILWYIEYDRRLPFAVSQKVAAYKELISTFLHYGYTKEDFTDRLIEKIASYTVPANYKPEKARKEWLRINTLYLKETVVEMLSEFKTVAISDEDIKKESRHERLKTLIPEEEKSTKRNQSGDIEDENVSLEGERFAPELDRSKIKDTNPGTPVDLDGLLKSMFEDGEDDV